MNDPRVQAMFRRSRRNNFSIFIISQDYYELPKKLYEPMEISTTSSNPIFSEVLKISSKSKQVWIRHLMILNY